MSLKWILWYAQFPSIIIDLHFHIIAKDLMLLIRNVLTEIYGKTKGLSIEIKHNEKIYYQFQSILNSNFHSWKWKCKKQKCVFYTCTYILLNKKEIKNFQFHLMFAFISFFDLKTYIIYILYKVKCLYFLSLLNYKFPVLIEHLVFGYFTKIKYSAISLNNC